MLKGTITNIRPNRDDGRGFGTISPDNGGGDLAFDNRSVEGPWQRLVHILRDLFRVGPRRERPFDRLSVGERVRLRLGEHPLQPHRAYAVCVRPVVTRTRR